MENRIDQIQVLYDKWMSRTASAEEMQELLQLIGEEDFQHVLAPLFRQTWEELLLQDHTLDERHKGMAQMIVSRHPAIADERPTIRRMGNIYRWIAAAVAILVIGTGIYHVIKTGKQQTLSSLAATNAEVAPGRTGAILTLANGVQVNLDTVQNGIVAPQGGATAKVANGVLLYEGNGNELVYNTMSTPRGRQFQVTLPDGTRVWLNSASSIRYPTVFTGNERSVSISGEAYFEVAKNKKMPFRIKVNGRAEVEVLGTHFNVNAYDNEKSLNTTLIEGMVKVSVTMPSHVHNGPPPVILKPGQQARVIAGNLINVVNDADIEKILAWKEGFFNFDNVPFDEVMRQLERWYDIDVVFEKGIPDIQFEGKITRDLPLNGLLIALERSDVHFRIDGRKLIVQP